MARMKARMIAALGVIFALALTPRAALASDYTYLDPTYFSCVPVDNVTSSSTDDFTIPTTLYAYPFLPYEVPYTDTTSSSYVETGSAHSDVLLTEQEYTIDLNQFDAKIKLWIPTIQMYPTSTQTGFTFPNPYKSSSTVINGSITWPSNFYISGNSGGTGAWYIDGHFWDVNGNYYSKEDQFTVNEHDLTGDIATDYGSEGLTTGQIVHNERLGSGLYYSDCPVPSGDECTILVCLHGTFRGATHYGWKKGSVFRCFNSYYNYWVDDYSSAIRNLAVTGWAYESGGVWHIVKSWSNGQLVLPENASGVGVLLNRNSRTFLWSERIVMRPPMLYWVDTTVEDTITYETELQTDTMMDTTGSGSVLTDLTSGGVEDFNSKIGLLGQLPQVIERTSNAILDASESDAVTFPGITVQGITLVQQQQVHLWQNGLSAFKEPVKMACTFMFVVAWVNGMKRVLDVQILGEDGSVEE